MIFAVDFDGTIVEHGFPGIGEELPGAIETLQDLRKSGHKIILWTCRTGKWVDFAIYWLKSRGFTPDAVNENIDKDLDFGFPKIYASVYIDDRNYGGFPGWHAIRAEYLYKGDTK